MTGSSDSSAGSEAQSWQARAGAVLEPELADLKLPPALLAKVFGHARECYPEECCGLLVGQGPSSSWRAVRCANVQNARKARGESDIGAREAFWIDPQELLEALKETERRGEQMQAIYHSHIDTAVYLSHTDLRAVLVDGRPVWPQVAQVVVSVWEDGVREAGWFEWDPEAARFRGRRARERQEGER